MTTAATKKTRCPTCGTPCRRCHPPPFLPTNPRVTVLEVLRIAAELGGVVTAADVARRVEGMSPEDASNRLRTLKRRGWAEISGREGRRLFYRLTDVGRTVLSQNRKKGTR